MPDALLVTSSFLPGRGGIETYLAELCARIAPRVAVMAPARRDGLDLPEGRGYPTIGYPGPMLAPRARIATAIEKAAGELGTDKILFGTPWPLALLGPRLRRAGLRYAAIVHGAEMLVPAAVPFVRARLGRALGGADLLLPVSEYTAGHLRRLIHKSGHAVPPIECLRARVDLDRYHPDVDVTGVRSDYGVGPDDKVVLCLGRVIKRKGIDRLIRAAPALRSRHPNLRIVVGGTGPELKRLRRLAADVHAPTIFTGRVPDDDAPALYALADVFALPVVDRWFRLEVEGLGVVLLEAQACGTPCVTGRSGGTPEAVVDGATGSVIDARDETQLVAALDALLSDPERARAMGAAGREHVARHFSGKDLPTGFARWLRTPPSVP